jgi:hypothetical protein
MYADVSNHFQVEVEAKDEETEVLNKNSQFM